MDALFKLLIVGGFALLLINPTLFVAAVGVILGGWFLANFDFKSLLPETNEQKEKRKLQALSHLRASSDERKNFAAAQNKSFTNPIKSHGYVYAFAQRRVFVNDRRIMKEDQYDGNAMKIGFTTGDLDVRAVELEDEYITRIFDPVVVAEVNWCYEVEQRVHEILSSKWLWREMFDVTPEEAENVIRDAVKSIDGAKIIHIEKNNVRSERFQKGERSMSPPIDIDYEIPF